MWRQYCAAAVAVFAAAAVPAAQGSERSCEALAASPYEAGMADAGVRMEAMQGEAAVHACQQAVADAPTAVNRYRLGRALLATQDYGEAYTNAVESASLGYVLAWSLLGVLYEQGLGVAADPTQAARHYRRAAMQGDSLGLFHLGRMYSYGTGVTHSEAEAASWFRRSAELGLPEAKNYLGWMLLNGRGVDRDTEEAMRLLRSAAERGIFAAQFHVGHAHVYGNDVTASDHTVALQWFSRASDGGHVASSYYRGWLLLHGRGVQSDPAAAANWLKFAAEQGHARAQLQLGRLYHTGTGVPQSHADSQRWLLQAADQGNLSDAHFLLGFFAETETIGTGVDYAEAARRYHIAAERGHLEAQTSLGQLLSEGRGMQADPAAAAVWLTRAADNGHARAQNNLGILYLNGHGVPQDRAKARELFTLAAEQGYELAQRNLDASQPITGRDLANAFTLLMTGLSPEDPASRQSLAGAGSEGRDSSGRRVWTGEPVAGSDPRCATMFRLCNRGCIRQDDGSYIYNTRDGRFWFRPDGARLAPADAPALRCAAQ